MARRSATATDISAVVGQIYEAAYDQTQWRSAIASLCILFDGARACIIRSDNADYGAIGSYEDDLEQKDWSALRGSLMARGMLGVEVGRIYLRRQIVNEAEFRRSILWQHHFQPRQMDDNLSCNLRVDGKSFWAVDVSRASRQGAFDAADMDIMRLITPHILRAGEIGEKLGNVSTQSRLYENLPFGMAIIDGGMRVCHANRAAEALFARVDAPLRVSYGRLICVMAELERMIVGVCGGAADGSLGTGGTVILSARNAVPDGPRLLVSVAPLAQTVSYGLLSRRSAALMFREIGHEPTEHLPQDLRNVFGLSPAEARLAAGLMAGHSLAVVAAAQGIKVKTARSYLENVFRKTGTHRQGELVALMKTTQPIIEQNEF